MLKVSFSSYIQTYRIFFSLDGFDWLSLRHVSHKDKRQKMVIKYLTILCELCVLMVSSSIVKRSYQDFPLQMCPQSAVCSDIYGLPSQGLGPASYMIQFKCKCPSGSECPSMPGPQTLTTDVDRWYGLCQPVEDIPQCRQPGEIAEQVIVDGPELSTQTYVKVHCTCPGHLFNDRSPATVWRDSAPSSSGAKYVHNLMCNNDDLMTKRGRYGGGGSRSRGRFYFYKK
ncbi:uncharacterized protein LOC123554750 isoform X2 [Mercenaria mercenaria]|uniref:uncharacterized protein LOC123554750 isoform X2 n=1 Tax=Mercenaria mercenaria TaxID=6596 RepID=UPI00234FADD5|nr:uncharacterized protein LOC123554750 isoform X2 [Mercenaria mercenaria]